MSWPHVYDGTPTFCLVTGLESISIAATIQILWGKNLILMVNGDMKNYISKSTPPANLFLSEEKASGVIVVLP